MLTFTKVEQERLEHKTRSTLLKSNRERLEHKTRSTLLKSNRTAKASTQSSFDFTKVEQERLEHNFINFIKVRVRKCHFGATVHNY